MVTSFPLERMSTQRCFYGTDMIPFAQSAEILPLEIEENDIKKMRREKRC